MYVEYLEISGLATCINWNERSGRLQHLSRTVEVSRKRNNWQHQLALTMKTKTRSPVSLYPNLAKPTTYVHKTHKASQVRVNPIYTYGQITMWRHSAYKYHSGWFKWKEFLREGPSTVAETSAMYMFTNDGVASLTLEKLHNWNHRTMQCFSPWFIHLVRFRTDLRSGYWSSKFSALLGLG